MIIAEKLISDLQQILQDEDKHLGQSHTAKFLRSFCECKTEDAIEAARKLVSENDLGANIARSLLQTIWQARNHDIRFGKLVADNNAQFKDFATLGSHGLTAS